MIIAERIRAARGRAFLTQQELAHRIGVTKQAISKYEGGQSTPGSGVLSAMADALAVTVDSLLRPSLVTIGDAEFRQETSKVKERDRENLKAIAEDGLERQLLLEEIVYGRTCHPRFQGLRGIVVRSADDAEGAADTCRARLNLGSDPIANLMELAEGWCIRIVSVPVSVAGFDGLAQWVTSDIPFIMLADDPLKGGDRQRLTLGHELAHLICDFSELPGDKKARETASYRFGTSLLIPRETMVSLLGKSRSMLDWKELFHIKQTYGISMAALLFRAKDCGIITAATSERMWRQYNKNKWRRNEPGHIAKEQPTAMFRLVERALAEKLINDARAAELSGMSLAEFMTWRNGLLAGNVHCD